MELTLLPFILATIFALFGTPGFAQTSASSSAPAASPGSGSFTQDCLALGLSFAASCNATSALSKTCCQALDAFNHRGCFCNGAVTGNFPASDLALVIQAGPVILQLCSTATAILQPAANNCPAAATAIGACGVPDWKIDAERVALLRGTDTVFTFLAPFLAGNSSATLTSPGVGSSYSGSQEIEEFTAFVNPALNDGVQLLDYNATTDSVPDFGGNNTITAKVDVQVTIPAPTAGPALLSIQTHNSSTSITFEPCSSKIQSLSKSRPSDLVLCSKIQSACKGPNQQYDSVLDCVNFFDTLPDRACTQSVFAGNCKSCRFLHYILAKKTPEVHCQHAGKTGGPDRNGHYKCVDSFCVGQLTPEAVFLNGTRAAQLKMLGGLFTN